MVRHDVHSEFRGFSLQSACDNNPKALQALKCLTTHEGWPAAFAPQHLFGDLLDSVLHDDVREAMMQAVKDGMPPMLETPERWLEVLVGMASPEFTPDSRRPCLLHPGSARFGGCPMFPASAKAEADGQACQAPTTDKDEASAQLAVQTSLKICVAGNTCIDFSKRGKRRKMAGGTMVPFAVFMAPLRSSGSDAGILECTEDMPDEMIKGPLQRYCPGDAQWKMMVFWLDLAHQGVLAHRFRRYTVVWNETRVLFHGSPQEFDNLTCRSLAVHGDVFFASGEKYSDVEASKSTTTRLHYQLYHDLHAERQDSGRAKRVNIADLNQKPAFSGMSEVVPTLCTNHTILCMEKDMLLPPHGSFDVQLLPLDSPVRSASLTPAACRHLAGNSMNAVSIGTLLLYVVSNLLRREVPVQRIQRGSSLLAGFLEVEEETGGLW